MMDGAGLSLWWPVIVSAAIQLIGIGTIYGTIRTKLQHHDQEITNLRRSDQRQWSELDEQGRELGFLKGKLDKAR